jgi:DNA-binding HxlR family transcriptional regulator
LASRGQKKSARKSEGDSREGYQRLEDVIGCKWSVSVLEAVRKGINRPGALEAYITGISTKVLSERLRKLTDYGLLDKRVYVEIPPRTEYALTRYGAALGDILSRIQILEAELGGEDGDHPPGIGG